MRLRSIGLVGVALAGVGLVGALGGCQKASDATSAKRSPQPPPPPKAIEPPAGLRIEVVLDGGGKPATAIDAARLRAVPPDFVDPERRAWKLSTLLGSELTPPGTDFVVTGAATAELLLRQPASATDPQPALMLNRRGEVVAAMLTPNAPFPPFHGEGGRLGRPGDTTPHLGGVVRIQVAHTIK